MPRHTVFVLDDGTVVVQWEAQQVQDLLSGRYRPYESRIYGRAITDADLELLKESGCVEHYDRQFVWLYAQPEHERFRHLHTQEQALSRVRSFYLNTMLPVSEWEALDRRLEQLGVARQYTLRDIEGALAVFSAGGKPFSRLKDAEAAQRQLVELAPDPFAAAAVAFIETNVDETPRDMIMDTGSLDLNDLIASQDAKDAFVGKRALLVCSQDEECQQGMSVLVELGLDVQAAATGQSALRQMEEWQPDLLVMDLQLPDMHGWQMLSKAREILDFSRMRVIAMASAELNDSDHTLALTVARVHALLIKPVGGRRLRRSVWMALKATGQ